MSEEHHNARWLRLSASVRRERPICQDPFGWHKLSGHFAPSTCVHHVKSVDKRPDLMFDRDNLLALCQTCHDALHGQGEALTIVLRAGVPPNRAAVAVASGGVGGCLKPQCSPNYHTDPSARECEEFYGGRGKERSDDGQCHNHFF